MAYRIIVFDWSPNGTNDLVIVKGTRIVESISEATFGINISKYGAFNFNQSGEHAAYVPIQTVLQNIAVSPVSDGLDTINTLKKYFKTIK